MTEKVIILGSGPAGYTAAIYAARAGLNPLLIEGSEPGGQLMITTDVDNFPGFPKGIKGPELVEAMKVQAERFGTRTVFGRVSNVDLSKRPFELAIDKDIFKCESLIICTGASARWLGISSEKALMGKGVSACATCDGYFFKGEDVAVVGGGDTALEEASYLSHIVKSVKVIHRRDKLRASKAMQDRANADPKISFVWNSLVEEIKDVSKGKVTSVVVKNVKDGKVSEIRCGGLFVAIGHDPNTGLFKGQLNLNENRYIITKPNSCVTNIKGVFAAGDVCDPVYRQAITAAGMGCMAALDVEKFLGGL